MNRAVALIAVLVAGVATVAGSTSAGQAPEFTHRGSADWINSEPITLRNLRGRVVLVEFWTYGCSNCRNTLPWLKAMHERYRGRGLVVVGVHTPEFEQERDADNVRAAVERLDIEYPVMLDPDSSTWKAFGNRYWPAFYLVGPTGRIETATIGELHEGTARGDALERSIRNLLDEG